ncbi:hypothetical protein ES708_28146 [subsurface metagenome]
MALILFSFVFNPETKEGTIAGNVEAGVALNILQQLVIAQAIQAAEQAKEVKREKHESKAVPKL